MNRDLRIALGLLVPSLLALLILGLVYPGVNALDTIDSMIVLVMLGFILTSVASSAFSAYVFRGLVFKRKTDLWLIYANTYPWILFIVLFADKFWILSIPLIFTPVLGYWFGKRFFAL